MLLGPTGVGRCGRGRVWGLCHVGGALNEGVGARCPSRRGLPPGRLRPGGPLCPRDMLVPGPRLQPHASEPWWLGEVVSRRGRGGVGGGGVRQAQFLRLPFPRCHQADFGLEARAPEGPVGSWATFAPHAVLSRTAASNRKKQVAIRKYWVAIGKTHVCVGANVPQSDGGGGGERVPMGVKAPQADFGLEARCRPGTCWSLGHA